MTFVTQENQDCTITRFNAESKENNLALQNSENSAFSAQLFGKAKDFQVVSDVSFPCIPSAEHSTDVGLTPLRRATFIKSRSFGPGMSPQKEISGKVALHDKERITVKNQQSPLREKNYGTGSSSASVHELQSHNFPSSVLENGSVADIQTLTPSRRTTFVKCQTNLRQTPRTENNSTTASKSVSPPISTKRSHWHSRTVDDMSVASVPDTPSGLLRSGTYTKLNSSLSPLRSYIQSSTSPTIDEEDHQAFFSEGSAKRLSQAGERRKAGSLRDVTSSNDILEEKLMMLQSKCLVDATQSECQSEDSPPETQYETAKNTPLETPVDSDHEEPFQDSIVCLSHNASGMLSCSAVPCRDIHCCWSKQDQTFDPNSEGKEVIVMETVEEVSFVQEAYVFETRVNIEQVEEILVEETGYNVGDNSKLEYREVEVVDRKKTRQTKSVKESAVLSRDFVYSDVRSGANVDGMSCGNETKYKTEWMTSEVKSTVFESMSEVHFEGSSVGTVDLTDVDDLSPEYKCMTLKPGLFNELNVPTWAASGSLGRLSSTPAGKQYSLLVPGLLEMNLENANVEAPSPIDKQLSEIVTAPQSHCLKNALVPKAGHTFIIDNSQSHYGQVSVMSASAEMENNLPSLIGVTVTKTKPGVTQMENVKGRHGLSANRALFECKNSLQSDQAVAENNSDDTKYKWKAEIHPLEEDAGTDTNDGHSRQIGNMTITKKYPGLPPPFHDRESKISACKQSQSCSILCTPSSKQMPSALKCESASKRRHVEGDASPRKKRMNSDGGRPAPTGSGRLASQGQFPAKEFSGGSSQKATSARETHSDNGPVFQGW